MLHQNTKRILTTHTGSLPRPQPLQDLLFAQEQEPGSIEPGRLAKQAQESVSAVVRQQINTGLDIINDGEMGKINYVTYVKDRLTGFQGSGPSTNFQSMVELLEFPEFAARMMAAAAPLMRIRYPSCTGPVTYTGLDHLNLDIKNLKEALHGETPPAYS